MKEQELINIKCELAMSYVQAVAAKCNYAINISGRSYDGLGIDCSITNFNIGNKPDIPIPGNEIKVQVKGFSRSSLSMYTDNGTMLKYNIKDIVPPCRLFYLVLLELPEEDKLDEWLEVTNESMIMKRCAYYVKIKERQTGFIDIPKTQIFTTTTLPSLFPRTVEDFINEHV